MSWVEAIFVLLSLVTLGSAVLVVTTPHLVHAALWLVVTLGSVAGIFLVLAAEFVAWVQVLIYVGAVVVLLLFALMLTRAPTGRQDDLTVRRAAPAALVAGLVGVLLAVTGFFLLTGQLWARIVGIAVAVLSAVANFLFIPYYPVWALIIIALDVAVIWALATDRSQRA